MTRRLTLTLLIATYAVLQATSVTAALAAIGNVDAAEVRRGFLLVGARASDEPALRLERQTHEPSKSLTLGAALGAWVNAAAILDYDLKTPTGDGGDDEAIGVDCYDERVAFTHLEARREAFGLPPSQVTSAAGVVDGAILPLWMNRQRAGAPARCH